MASHDDVRKACFEVRVRSPFPSGTSRDRGRQRFARRVRLPQPMGAGGRRPPVGPFVVTPVPRRTRRAEAITVKSRVIRGWNRQRELSDPATETDYQR
jgi:hypothetical protein